MDPSDLKAFIRKCLARGVMGASVGFVAVSSAAAAKPPAPFSQRLSKVREAVTQVIDEQQQPDQLQGTLPGPGPRPPPPHPPPPFSKFANWDNAAPFTNFDQKTPFTNFGKAPLK